MFIQCFASGTNVQRLAKCASSVDGVIYSAYSELEKTEPKILKRKFYCTNVSSLKKAVEQAFDVEVMPTWTKIWGDPYANQAFVEQLFISLVGGDTQRRELNLSAISGDSVNCFMMFVSANKKQMGQLAKIINVSNDPILSQYEVQVLNGDYTSNKEAEDETLTLINKSKLTVNGKSKRGLIIISNTMGSRSYSIPAIQATVFAFDRGGVDATAQKGSRSLTPTKDNKKLYDGSDKTYGMIVDLSFDPNRNENLEKIILEEAIQLQRGGTTNDIPSAVSYILSAANMFKLNEYGHMVLCSEEDLYKVYGENENLLKVADITVDINLLSDYIIDQLDNVSADGKKSPLKDAVSEGTKNKVTVGTKDKDSKNKKDKELAKKEEIINRAIKALNNSATSVYIMCKGNTYRDCIFGISKNTELNNEFIELFGVSASFVLLLLDDQILNEAILDIVVQNSKTYYKAAKLF
jgi:hypothetical protein